MKHETTFPEIAGKTVTSIKYEENSDWQGLEVAFTDGTLFSLEFSARATVKASFLEVRAGNLEMIRSYGRVSGNPEEIA